MFKNILWNINIDYYQDKPEGTRTDIKNTLITCHPELFSIYAKEHLSNKLF